MAEREHRDMDALLKRLIGPVLMGLLLSVSLFWILSGVDLPKRSGPPVLGISILVAAALTGLLAALGYRHRAGASYFAVSFMVILLLAFILVAGGLMVITYFRL